MLTPSDSVQASLSTPMPHQVFSGTTWHHRLLPSVHKFAYPYRYWGVNITALAAGQALPEVALSIFEYKNSVTKKLVNAVSKIGKLFSAQHKALQQFCAADYLTDWQDLNKGQNQNAKDLERRLQQSFIDNTGSAPSGEMMGMVVCRNAGMYFSPVNFYLGFDAEQNPTHLLAEVSNTPWNKRHYYGFLLDGAESEFTHDKDFHVSPFNPIDQCYHWRVGVEKLSDSGLQVRIAINISDLRGEVLKTGIKMSGVPMTEESIIHSLRQNPLMNISSMLRIYSHAFKLYAIKKVPYINYDEKLADSQQQNTD